MTKRRSHAGRHPALMLGRGFLALTLVEILVVCAIMTLLLAIAVPVTIGVWRSLLISQGGETIHSQLELARQTALARNRTVEVRFCRASPGASFNAIMPLVCVATSPTGIYVYSAIGKPSFLPVGAIIDAGATLSTLLNQTNAPTSNAPVHSPNATDPTLGSLQLNYQYVAFHFKPDGSTDLIPETSASTNTNNTNLWFLTVHTATDGDSLLAAPKNFYTIQIDAYNGHLVDYRP
jgi:uncharacterized protein (TIGR02596 family)